MWRRSLTVFALVTAACTSSSSDADTSARRSPEPTTTAPAGTPRPSCPTSYVAPDPHRPRVSLSFVIGTDHARVTGRERVVFTPDRRVDRLVFRLWSNLPVSRDNGARMSVTSTAVAGGAVRPAPSSDPTLLTLPLPAPVPAGRTVRADLGFTLNLPPASFDRLGHTNTLAWWGSGFPLLAWQRHRGWVTTTPGQLLGEYAVSEAAAMTITVTAPAGDEVLFTGRGSGPRPGGPGQARWRATVAAARDAVVTVGALDVRRDEVAGVPLTVAAPRPAGDLRPLVDLVRAAVLGHARRFGPFPYESLAVTQLSYLRSGGVEYPGAVLVGVQRPQLVVDHEVAHQWFYGLVGDDQARDPWLDEAFATYAQGLLDGQLVSRYQSALVLPGRVGQPITAFPSSEAYAAIVYGKGAAALLVARQNARPARFDAAIRCYVRVAAWGVATPADLSRALAGLSPALRELRVTGALP